MRHEREQKSETDSVDADVGDARSGAHLRSSESTRPSRASVRPSAFGPPRPSRPPPVAVPPRELSAPSFFDDSAPEPTPSGTRRRLPREISFEPAETRTEQAARPGETFRADLEELLPFVGPKSLPREPQLSALPERPAARSTDPRRTRVSVLIFGATLLASAVPLLRYAGVNGSNREVPPIEAAVTTPVPLAAAPAAPATSAPPAPLSGPHTQAPAAGDDGTRSTAIGAELERVEAGLPSNPVAAADVLLREGLKALSAGDPKLAEAFLARALKRDDDNPRAHYALAQIRVGQGNLEGAEGWVTLALRKRPRRAEYHALYARILEGLGRHAEATQERARAAELSADRQR